MLCKAVIDLCAIRENAKKIREKLGKNTRFCAVVKADAYGHGAAKVASALYGSADCFAVALQEEAVILRLSGIDKDILVFTPPATKGDADLAVRYGLISTVAGKEHLRLLSAAAERQSRTARFHVKFNTGMNRLGLNSLKDLDYIMRAAANDGRVSAEGVYSHLAAPENKNYVKRAADGFLLANNLVKGYNNRAVAHISASGGFLNGVKSEMVRIGILLYGYKPFPSDAINLSRAMKVFAPVVGKRSLKAGECALYGERAASRPLDISLVRYGYADGLMRAETEGQFNARCMDITAYMGKSVGKNMTCVMDDADAVAAKYGTISYEILTKAALRAEKIYLN